MRVKVMLIGMPLVSGCAGLDTAQLQAEERDDDNGAESTDYQERIKDLEAERDALKEENQRLRQDLRGLRMHHNNTMFLNIAIQADYRKAIYVLNAIVDSYSSSVIDRTQLKEAVHEDSEFVYHYMYSPEYYHDVWWPLHKMYQYLDIGFKALDGCEDDDPFECGVFVSLMECANRMQDALHDRFKSEYDIVRAQYPNHPHGEITFTPVAFVQEEDPQPEPNNNEYCIEG